MFWTCCIISMIQYTLWLWLEWEVCVNCKLVRWIPTKCDTNNKKWHNKWQYKTYKIRQIIILKCNITVACPYYVSGKWQNTTEKVLSMRMSREMKSEAKCSSSSSSALQLFVSFGLLNYSSPWFPFLCLLFPIIYSHLPQIVSHVIIPF